MSIKFERRTNLLGDELIYYHDEIKNLRYALGEPKYNSMLFIGINPNTATSTKYDLTTNKIIKFASINQFNGWVLVNLIPDRSLSPKMLVKEENKPRLIQNADVIRKLIVQFEINSVCCCWGNSITTRSYLINSLKLICKNLENVDYFHLGSLTKGGHPKHPSRLGYNSSLNKMDINQYIHNFTNI